MHTYYDEQLRDTVCCAGELIEVTAVETLDRHQLRLTFTNGEIRRYDVAPLLGKGVFARLQSPLLFKQAAVAYGTVVWDGGNIDLAPETLYEKSVPEC